MTVEARSIEARLQELGIELPPPPQPLGAYAPAVRTGNLLYVSGMVPREGGKISSPGRLGREVSIEAGARAARLCALLALSAARAALGTLDPIRRVVRVGGYVSSAPGFTDQPKVVNGASDLLLEVFGEAGRHARIALGVSSLPGDAAVEVEILFEIVP